MLVPGKSNEPWRMTVSALTCPSFWRMSQSARDQICPSWWTSPLGSPGPPIEERLLEFGPQQWKPPPSSPGPVICGLFAPPPGG